MVFASDCGKIESMKMIVIMMTVMTSSQSPTAISWSLHAGKQGIFSPSGLVIVV